jgi:hypothetical protein
VGNDSPGSFVDNLEQGLGELVDVPIGVDVAGCLDAFVAEQLLDGLEVAGLVEDTLARTVPGLVHPFPAGCAFAHNPGPGQAPVPPVVQAVDAHRPAGKTVDDGLAFVGYRLLPCEQIIVRAGFLLNLQPPEVMPERDLGDRNFADRLAFREDRQPSPLMVEVLELDFLEGALAEPLVEQQPESETVTEPRLRGENRCPLVFGERRPVHPAFPGAFDWQRRVPMEAAA